MLVRYYQNNLIEVAQALEQIVQKPYMHSQKNDFISKYSIALKEASETLYWIKIMVKSELVSEQKFSKMQEEIIVIIKILTSIINKLKSS
jgi:four helix bundle protein